MITLISICDLFWLFWLLPFLLGALLWWMGNSKYNKMVAEYDGKIKGLNGKISGLEGDLSDCSSKRANLEGDLAVTKGRMREMESSMTALKAAAKDSGKSTGSKPDDRYNKMVADYDNKIKSLNSKISGLEGDLSDSKSRLKDTEASMNAMKIAKESNSDLKGTSGDLGASALTASGASAISSSSADTGSSSGQGTGNSSGATEGESKKSIYSGIKGDNLQIIEGIGPKMESILKENGVNTLADLGGKTTEEVQGILDKYGDKYKIIDPLTWSQQAGYAAKGDYEGLIDLQKRLDTGKDNASGMTDSKLEKYLIKTGAIKSFKQDDLKAIEGIGPATEKLLHSNGIMTWRDLANTSATSVKAMLTEAGSRFALGDPTTWPKQAELAADGKFDELREYQDFLDGGRG